MVKSSEVTYFRKKTAIENNTIFKIDFRRLAHYLIAQVFDLERWNRIV